jgi:integrase
MSKEATEFQSDPYSLFTFALNSPSTKEKYVPRLEKFFDFIDLSGTMQEKCSIFAKKAIDQPSWALSSVIKYVEMNKDRIERKEISAGTLLNNVKVIKLFSEMNDIPLPWKKITRGLPKSRRYADDRAPTLEELQKIMEYPDRRIKAIISTMVSSGIRLGAWNYLKWKHITPLIRDEKVVAAKIIVYSGDPEQYFSFITPEAFFELEKWILYRKECGENITEETWLMRNIWDRNKGSRRKPGIISRPRKLQSQGIKRIMETALWTQGLRSKLEHGKRRHEFQADHGLRKFFKTRCELAGMMPINIEILMGHSVGISDSYYRATENELLSDYLKAIGLLTIIEDKTKLEAKIIELTEKNRNSDDATNKKFLEKVKEIQDMKKEINLIKEGQKELYELLKPVKKLLNILEKD